MTNEVRIPDIGDAEDVEVIEIMVDVGATVAENDALIVIESDKASMEVPAPFAGVVEAIHVALGDIVNADDLIVSVTRAEADIDMPAEPPPETVDSPAVATPPEPVQEEKPATPRLPEPSSNGSTAREPTSEGASSASIYAGPAVRRLARELGVDLGHVQGTGARGRIVKDDVKAFVKTTLNAPTGLTPSFNLDFSKFGEVETVPLTRVQARGAANLAKSWAAVVHVTQHDEADVTDLEAFRQTLKPEAGAREVNLTPLPFIMKAVAHNLRAHPRANASLSADVTALIEKRYIHLGFAVDTADGLLVPVIRDVDQKGVWQLAEEIGALSEAARTKRLRPDDLSGASFTISSLGAIGGTGFTPIVNAPEVAILGVARLATKPIWDGASFQPRKMLPLSLSYDHRALNGAESGRFMADLVALLSDFRRLSL